jgi:hypothetical protein
VKKNVNPHFSHGGLCCRLCRRQSRIYLKGVAKPQNAACHNNHFVPTPAGNRGGAQAKAFWMVACYAYFFYRKSTTAQQPADGGGLPTSPRVGRAFRKKSGKPFSRRYTAA